MGYFTTLKNQPTTIDPVTDYAYQGWEISGGIATHYPCNAGIMTAMGKPIIIGKTYTVTYEVSNYISGSVKIMLGTTSGTIRIANGIYAEDILVAGNTVITMYSDGYLSVKYIGAYEKQLANIDNSLTVAFNENTNFWSSYYSFVPELMLRFINKFFMFQNGAIWESNTNETRNNFFGVQYNSEIEFYENKSPTVLKLYFSMRVISNKVWYAPKSEDLFIPAIEGKPNGMASRLKKKNFKNLQGQWFADFLRNINDPNYSDELTALTKGEQLRGEHMRVRLINTDTTEVILFEVDIKTSKSEYSY